jgi:site-specific DNA-methyltransferase (adenine-specific)
LPRTSHWTATAWENAGWEVRDRIAHLFGTGFPKSANQLKPACEDWWLLRKPLIGSVANNVLVHGTGAVNIDASRVPYTSESDFENAKGGNSGSVSCDMDGWGFKTAKSQSEKISTDGRWPANVTHDGSDEVLEAFATFGDKPTGDLKRVNSSIGGNGIYQGGKGGDRNHAGGTGTAARFFYCAKASKTERAGSKHPTVKPVSLMRYLCRLVTPPNGIVLDPFAGTGSTGQAAVDEGFNAILIEQDPEYCTTIRCRLALWLTPAPDPAALLHQSPSLPSPDANQDSCEDISLPHHGNVHPRTTLAVDDDRSPDQAQAARPDGLAWEPD